MTDEFGWSRRNAFIQPQVDAVMLEGLSRFPNVRCLFSRELEAFSQQNGEVTLNLKAPDGQRETVKAQWLVACDGGGSNVRRSLNVPFEGKTAPNQWIVVDNKIILRIRQTQRLFISRRHFTVVNSRRIQEPMVFGITL